MKRYTARTVQDAVNTACQELGVTIDELNYEVISETKTLFTKKLKLSVIQFQ
ncbi:MAG: Jag N-terminal domain-containing protein [Thomasclavelia ramosa]